MHDMGDEIPDAREQPDKPEHTKVRGFGENGSEHGSVVLSSPFVAARRAARACFLPPKSMSATSVPPIAVSQKHARRPATSQAKQMLANDDALISTKMPRECVHMLLEHHLEPQVVWLIRWNSQETSRQETH